MNPNWECAAEGALTVCFSGGSPGRRKLACLSSSLILKRSIGSAEQRIFARVGDHWNRTGDSMCQAVSVSCPSITVILIRSTRITAFDSDTIVVDSESGPFCPSNTVFPTNRKFLRRLIKQRLKAFLKSPGAVAHEISNLARRQFRHFRIFPRKNTTRSGKAPDASPPFGFTSR